MNSDTQALLQYLSTLLEAVESRGVQDGSFRAEALNEIVELNRDPDFKGEMRPTGKSMIVMSWTWGEPTAPAMTAHSEGERVEMSDYGE